MAVGNTYSVHVHNFYYCTWTVRAYSEVVHPYRCGKEQIQPGIPHKVFH